MAISSGISGRLARVSGMWRRVMSWIATRSGTEPANDHVAFAVGVIALGAKMAKADGVVSIDEVNAFKEVFKAPEAEMRHVANVFNLAKQNVAGYEIYADRLATMFKGNRFLPVIPGPLIILLAAVFHWFVFREESGVEWWTFAILIGLLAASQISTLSVAPRIPMVRGNQMGCGWCAHWCNRGHILHAPWSNPWSGARRLRV